MNIDIKYDSSEHKAITIMILNSYSASVFNLCKFHK